MTLDSVCNTCNKCVSSRNSIECNLCLTEIHFKRNNLSFVDGQVIKNANKSWFYLQCSKNIFPFTNINNYKLSLTVNSSDKQFSYDNDLNSTNTCLVLNPPENLTNLFNQFNDFSPDQKQNSDNIRNCKYYNIDEIQSLNKLNDKYSLSLFHINAYSLTKRLEDLELLLDSTQICFDVIAITETRILKINVQLLLLT